MSDAMTTRLAPTELNDRGLVGTYIREEPSTTISSAQLLVAALIATVAMLFAGFGSAYLVRREGLDWVRIQLPGVLWMNTAVLLASSVGMEFARRAYRHGNLAGVRQWAQTALVLGALFLSGQLYAWRQLAAQGVYLPTNPYSSFFYMLTALHGAHLLGGMLALCYLLWHVRRANSNAIRASALDGCATFWHFLDGIWICLYLLLLLY